MWESHSAGAFHVALDSRHTVGHFGDEILKCLNYTSRRAVSLSQKELVFVFRITLIS